MIVGHLQDIVHILILYTVKNGKLDAITVNKKTSPNKFGVG